MSPNTLTNPATTVAPLARLREVEPVEQFPPSAELGDQLDKVAKAQAEIDREKATELARLRAIQDRD